MGPERLYACVDGLYGDFGSPQKVKAASPELAASALAAAWFEAEQSPPEKRVVYVFNAITCGWQKFVVKRVVQASYFIDSK